MPEVVILTPEEKKEGIDLIEKIIDLGYGLGDEVVKDLKDGKMQWTEVAGLADNIFSIAMMIPKFPQLKAQVLDVDSDEVQQLIQHVIDLGFLPDNAVTIISNIVQALEKLYAVYVENIKPIIELIQANKK
jgi:hypothetical protein